MVVDEKIKKVNEYVDLDLQAIQQNNYTGIIQKMKMVSAEKLADTLAMLNFGIIDIQGEQPPDRRQAGISGGKIIPMSQYQTSSAVSKAKKGNRK